MQVRQPAGRRPAARLQGAQLAEDARRLERQRARQQRQARARARRERPPAERAGRALRVQPARDAAQRRAQRRDAGGAARRQRLPRLQSSAAAAFACVAPHGHTGATARDMLGTPALSAAPARAPGGAHRQPAAHPHSLVQHPAATPEERWWPSSDAPRKYMLSCELTSTARMTRQSAPTRAPRLCARAAVGWRARRSAPRRGPRLPPEPLGRDDGVLHRLARRVGQPGRHLLALGLQDQRPARPVAPGAPLRWRHVRQLHAQHCAAAVAQVRERPGHDLELLALLPQRALALARAASGPCIMQRVLHSARASHIVSTCDV